MMSNTRKKTYDCVCFGDLAYEFDFSDPKQTEKKIKQKLRYYGLGIYDHDRVEYLRELKNELFTEINLQAKSTYYKHSESNFAEFTDFDVDRMKKDYLKKYDKINGSDMSLILNFAIYLYHMR